MPEGAVLLDAAMFLILTSLATIGLILILNQYLWDKKIIKGEAARKFAHILIGSFIASWPVFLSWNQIKIALAIGLIAAIIVRGFHVFPSIADIKRNTVGDIAAPAIMLLAAFIEPTKTIFAVAVLHVAFADGMAAVIGSRFGHKNAYNIFKQKKSVAGTVTFYISSVLIMTAAAIARPTLDFPTFLLYIGAIPVAATFFENVTPRGLDNVTVPLIVVALLTLA